MGKPNRNDIYEAVIRRMVRQVLDEQELNFTRDHAVDSDQQLIAYIRQQAEFLHYTPRYQEIIGWKLISERFGSWQEAVDRAGLQITSNCPVSKLPRIVQETERQKEAYRQKKAEKKLRAQQRIKQQNEKKKLQKSKTQVCVPPPPCTDR